MPRSSPSTSPAKADTRVVEVVARPHNEVAGLEEPEPPARREPVQLVPGHLVQRPVPRQSLDQLLGCRVHVAQHDSSPVTIRNWGQSSESNYENWGQSRITVRVRNQSRGRGGSFPACTQLEAPSTGPIRHRYSLHQCPRYVRMATRRAQPYLSPLLRLPDQSAVACWLSGGSWAPSASLLFST